jgi:hypothetical protein
MSQTSFQTPPQPRRDGRPPFRFCSHRASASEAVEAPQCASGVRFTATPPSVDGQGRCSSNVTVAGDARAGAAERPAGPAPMMRWCFFFCNVLEGQCRVQDGVFFIPARGLGLGTNVDDLDICDKAVSRRKTEDEEEEGGFHLSILADTTLSRQIYSRTPGPAAGWLSLCATLAFTTSSTLRSHWSICPCACPTFQEYPNPVSPEEYHTRDRLFSRSRKRGVAVKLIITTVNSDPKAQR